jgi:hypothetical protein
MDSHDGADPDILKGPSTGWDTFCEWCELASRPDAPFIMRGRLAYVENVTFGLNVNSRKKKILTQWRARAVVDWETLETAASKGQGPYVPPAAELDSDVKMRDRDMELDALINEIRHRNLQVLNDVNPDGDSRHDALKAELNFVKGSVDFFEQLHTETMPTPDDATINPSTSDVPGPARETRPVLVSAYTPQDADRVAAFMAQEPNEPIPEQRTATSPVDPTVHAILADDDARIRIRPNDGASNIDDRILDYLAGWLQQPPGDAPSRGRAARPFVIFSEANPAPSTNSRISTFVSTVYGRGVPRENIGLLCMPSTSSDSDASDRGICPNVYDALFGTGPVPSNHPIFKCRMLIVPKCVYDDAALFAHLQHLCATRCVVEGTPVGERDPWGGLAIM